MAAPRDKEKLLDDIWGELVRAVNDRHHAWRTPTLATVDDQGFPQARSVVLRSANRTSNELRIFTDARTPKCQHLQQQPKAALQFWSKRLNWQLRVRLDTQVITEGKDVEAAWQRIYQSKAATDYLAIQPPGSLQLGDGQLGDGQLGDSQLGDGQLETERAITANSDHHLAIIVGRVCHMDWLELNREGHQRAQIIGDSLTWLVP